MVGTKASLIGTWREARTQAEVAEIGRSYNVSGWTIARLTADAFCKRSKLSGLMNPNISEPRAGPAQTKSTPECLWCCVRNYRRSADTAFHHCLPHVATRLAIPRHFDDEGIRRYGFHGISYEYIAQRLRAIAPESAAAALSPRTLAMVPACAR